MHFRALEIQCSQDATCCTCWTATELLTRIVEQYNVSSLNVSQQDITEALELVWHTATLLCCRVLNNKCADLLARKPLSPQYLGRFNSAGTGPRRRGFRQPSQSSRARGTLARNHDVPSPPSGEEIPPPPFGGLGVLSSLLGGEKGALPHGKSPWRRATCGWLDFGQVKQPRVGAVGYSLP